MFKKIFHISRGMDKYFLIAVLGICVIYAVNFIGVEIFNFKPQPNYIFSTAINCVISYFGNARIFKQRANKNNLFKFILSTAIFFFLNNFIFYILIKHINIHYLIAVTINMAIFPATKFFSYKYLVFNELYEQ